MLNLIALVVYALFSLLLLFISMASLIFFVNALFTEAPFVPVRKKVISQIIKTLNFKRSSVFYDLGCGDARVLLEAKDQVNDIRAIGVEKNLIVYLLAKWRTRNTSIEVRLGDIESISFKNATHIYMYLFPEIINKLLPKFKKECAKGTRIVSCDFAFNGMETDETIELPALKYNLCKKLYVYVLK